MMEIAYLIASFALGGGFCYGLWFIYTRKDITVSARQGMNPEGLRYGSRAPGFGSAKKEIELLLTDDSYQSPLLERWKNDALETKIQFICNITGIQHDTARSLLQHFGSIAKFMTVSEKQLMESKLLSDEDCKSIIKSINLQ